MLNNWVLEIIKGAIEPKKFYWLDKNKEPFNLSGKVAKLRIKPAGASEIVLESPVCLITNAVNAEITIAFTDLIINEYSFSKAEIVLQIDNRILKKGELKIKNWYD
jgi:hypothetical protein